MIGADGFGIAFDDDHWVKVPQIGACVIGNDVEIGANTTIDRGAIDDTVIEDGVKLDNQIQIAHNVRIGAHTAIAACTGIAGSVQIGAHCRIGGAAASPATCTSPITSRSRATPRSRNRSTSRASTAGVYPFEPNTRMARNCDRTCAVLRTHRSALESRDVAASPEQDET